MPNGVVVDISRIRPAHQRFLANHDAQFDRALSQSAIEHEVRQHVGSGILIARRSGNLVKSTTAKTIRTRNGHLVKVQNTAEYAKAQDGGSGLWGPHKNYYFIFPKGNYPLAFYWARKKQHVKFAWVVHPGVKPTHFLQVAADLSFKTRLALLRAAMRSAARQF